jgi:hypothetical protein
VASQLPVERFTLNPHWIVTVALTPPRDLAQAPPESLSHRPNVDREASTTTSRTHVREAQEVESRGLAFPSSLCIAERIAPELKKTRFIRVK